MKLARRLILGLGAAVILAVVLLEHARPVSAQGMTSAGVVIRNDGTVLIDPWVFYPPMQPPPPATPNESIKAPTKVIFGEAIDDKVLVCREGPLGSRCLPLGKLLPKLLP